MTLHRGFRPSRLVVAAALVLLATTPACAQSGDDPTSLRKELEALKVSQAELRKELDELKALLKPARPKAIMAAPPGLTVPITSAPSHGKADAPVVLVEYSDFECTFCGRFYRDTLPGIDRDLIQSGQLRHVFKAFPLESIHPHAFKAHEAAYCAGEQGKYWELHAVLFANQRALSVADLSGHAVTVGLDKGRFEACLASGKMAVRVKAEMDEAMRMGVTGTPMFLLGTPNPDGTITVKKGINGAHPAAVFAEAVADIVAGR